MSGFRRLCLVCILHVLCLFGSLESAASVTSFNQFNGGSISYSIGKNAAGKNVAHLDIITGWVLGKGPCGQHCSKADVGRDTRLTRQEMITMNSDPWYFGNWTAEFRISHAHHSQVKSLNSEIDSGMREIVLAVSEDAKWEQALMKVDVVLEDNLSPTEEIAFEGNSWHNLDLQGGSGVPWHIQTKLIVGIRNDTNQPNRCPQILVKPVYRIKLGETSRIYIAANDPDGDQVKCSIAKFVEAGDLSGRATVPGLVISQECYVTINATTTNGFRDDVWLAVAVMVRDNNMEHGFSLSATSAQFLVQVLENLNCPEFVDPTMEANHEFLLYADTTWTTTVYAEASKNTTIDEFVVVGRQEEIFQMSAIKQDPLRAQVRSVEVSWTPQAGDIGNHLMCVRAVDDLGVDSGVDRCFRITVIALCTAALPSVNHATHTSSSTNYMNGATVTYTCLNGYQLTTPSENRVTCDVISNRWTGNVPVCQATASRGVAFSVYLDHGADLVSQQVIKYNRVITNEGNGYNTQTGVFTCPMNGMYLFSFYIGERDARQQSAALRVNGQNTVDAMVDGFHTAQDLQSGNTVAVRLRQGDSVWVESMSDSQHVDGESTFRLTTFTGIFQYP